MFSNKTKTIAAGGIVILTLGIFALTGGVENVATVILGANTQVEKCIENLPEHKKKSEYTVMEARLNADAKKDLVLKATSEEQCGSAGCSHELCIVNNDKMEIIPFGYAAETLVVKDSLSNGMRDIQLTGKSTTNLRWDGARYTVVQ